MEVNSKLYRPSGDYLFPKSNPMKRIRTSVPLRRFITALLCGLMVFYTIACSYYKVSVKGPGHIPAVAAEQNKKFIYLHHQDEVYLLKSLAVSGAGESQSVSMKLVDANAPTSITPRLADQLPGDTLGWDTLYGNKPIYYPGRKKQYNAGKEGAVVQEVHFYLLEYTPGLAAGEVQLPTAAFKEVRVLKKDGGKTYLDGVMTGLGMIILLSIILAAVKSSCPYVYVFDGNNYIFQGEIYSGAVLRNLERADHLPMPLLQPVKGEYRLRIANELQEMQFVNLAEIQAIRHEQGTQALFDPQGRAQLIADPQLPLTAASASGADVSALTSQKDGQAFFFDEEKAASNFLHLQFSRPSGATAAKLVLRAKNSLWFDYLFGSFAEKWGTAWPEWIRQQEALPRETRVDRQNDQDFPLAVWVKDAAGQWRLAGRLPLTGPLGWRDMVLPLDPAMLQGEIVELRLETGYRFWEVDYAAMDFSENTGMEVLTLPALSAKDQRGRPQLKALAHDDDTYLRQLQTGEYTDMRFKAMAPPTGQAQTLFLHVKGYYEHVRDFEGEPQLAELQRFLKPHYFDQFSKQEYRRFMERVATSPDEILNQ